MSIRMIRPLRISSRALVALALLLGVLAAPVATQAAAQDSAPSLVILSPTAGQAVTGDSIDVQISVSNFTIDCTQSGRPDVDGVGHIHAMLDGMTMASLTNFYCGETFSFSGEGVAPGPHTLVVDLATNSHMDMADTVQQVEFDYQPATPVALPAANDLGEPGVTLVSPVDGATVAPKFEVQVDPVNFTPSANLEGKQNVPGYGHYHVFVDTPMGAMDSMGAMATPAMDATAMSGTPTEDHMDGMGGGMAMMSMGGMVLMPGSNTFELDLTAWGPGTHTIWIEPVQNDHTLFESFGHVEFTVVVEE